MVKDIRKLVFTSEELIAAFESYARKTPNFLPAGKLKSCMPIEQDGVKLTIEMQYGSSTHEAEFIYYSADVLRPLILYCIENNVILPRNGRKTYMNFGSSPALSIELDLDLDPYAMALPMHSEHIRLIKSDDNRPAPAEIIKATS